MIDRRRQVPVRGAQAASRREMERGRIVRIGRRLRSPFGGICRLVTGPGMMLAGAAMHCNLSSRWSMNCSICARLAGDLVVLDGHPRLRHSADSLVAFGQSRMRGVMQAAFSACHLHLCHQCSLDSDLVVGREVTKIFSNGVQFLQKW